MPTPPQIPGCLPEGFNEQSLLTVGQFAVWQQKSERSVREKINAAALKGVSGSGRSARIHVGTYSHFHVGNFKQAK